MMFYPAATVVEGQIIVGSWKIAARDRVITF
jgi:hypothetical protein